MDGKKAQQLIGAKAVTIWSGGSSAWLILSFARAGKGTGQNHGPCHLIVAINHNLYFTLRKYVSLAIGPFGQIDLQRKFFCDNLKSNDDTTPFAFLLKIKIHFIKKNRFSLLPLPMRKLYLTT